MVKSACVLGGAVILSHSALGQSPAVVNVSGGSLYPTYYGDSRGDVVGFRFTADVDMVVTHLGLYNDGRLGDGHGPGFVIGEGGTLNSAHEVGIWRDSDRALLGSAVIDAASGAPDGEFLYVAVTPFELEAGERYTAGANYAIDHDDWFIANPREVTLDGISGTVAAHPARVHLGFVYPELESPGNKGRFGPNFRWVPAGGGVHLFLSGDCPGRISANATGATPNGTVAYVFGADQGSTTIPGGPCAGTPLDVQRGVRLVGTDSADGSGHSSLSGNAPAGACGHYLQALDLSTCTTSNVAQIN